MHQQVGMRSIKKETKIMENEKATPEVEIKVDETQPVVEVVKEEAQPVVQVVPETEVDNEEDQKDGESDSDYLDRMEASINKASEKPKVVEVAKPEVKEVKEEKTPIDETLRKKLNIPEKFKYLEDVVKWGSEAEKDRGRLDTEKNKILEENKQYKAEIDELKAKIVKDVDSGTITAEEGQEAIDKFAEEFNENPKKAIENLILKTEQEKAKKQEILIQKQQVEERIKELRKTAEEEYAEIMNGREPSEIEELTKELKELSIKKPYIVSPKDLYTLLQHDKELVQKKLEQDKASKQKEKVGVGSTITSQSGRVQTEGVAEKIKSVSSLEELEKLEKAIN
jgi:hypothetical protein